MIVRPRDGLAPGLSQLIRAEAKIEAVLLSETFMERRDAEGLILGFSGYETGALRAAATRLGTTALKLADDSRW
ncbi:hypothetical protein D9M70_581830 [compost metagenome]